MAIDQPKMLGEQLPVRSQIKWLALLMLAVFMVALPLHAYAAESRYASC